MQIFLDSFGAFLCVKNQVFCVKPKDKPERTFAPIQVNAFFITKGITVTSDALFLALKHDIPIVLLDKTGHPAGQVWSGKYGSISTIRKQQTLWALHENSLEWLCKTLITKIQRQAEHLLVLRESVKNKDVSESVKNKDVSESVKNKDTFRMSATRAAPVLARQIDTLTDFKAYHLQSRNDDLAQLRGIEGAASAVYFRAIARALPPEFFFTERSRMPATDPFNAALNYAYGILYAMVELALIKAGLDPAIAVMHADRHNHNTMVFDCIEPYRVWADSVVCDAFINEKLAATHFYTLIEKDNGTRITTEGRQIIVGTLLAYLNTTTLYTDGQMRKRSTQIDFDALRIANFLKISKF